MWRGIAFLALVGVVLAAIKLGSVSPSEPQPSNAAMKTPAPAIETPALTSQERADALAAIKDVDALWNRFYGDGKKPVSKAELDKASAKLRLPPMQDPDFGGISTAMYRVATVRDRLERDARDAAERARLENDAAGRAAYARTVEENFLKQYKDVTVRTEGPKGTTLRIMYVLINRPFVYNFQNNHDISENLRKRGFKKVILWDGYNNSWTLTY